MDGVAFRTRDEATMNRIAYFIEMIAFSSRWLVAPFLLGLIFGLAVLLYKFVIKLVDFVGQVPGAETSDAIVGILNLVDLTLVANLIVIVICSSYENFVSPMTIPSTRLGHLVSLILDSRGSSRNCSAPSSRSRPSTYSNGSPTSTATPIA
jgi:uncharacterized membrane protein YqhA